MFNINVYKHSLGLEHLNSSSSLTLRKAEKILSYRNCCRAIGPIYYLVSMVQWMIQIGVSHRGLKKDLCVDIKRRPIGLNITKGNLPLYSVLGCHHSSLSHLAPFKLGNATNVNLALSLHRCSDYQLHWIQIRFVSSMGVFREGISRFNPLKRIRSCYKSLKVHKIMIKSRITPPNSPQPKFFLATSLVYSTI